MKKTDGLLKSNDKLSVSLASIGRGSITAKWGSSDRSGSNSLAPEEIAEVSFETLNGLGTRSRDKNESAPVAENKRERNLTKPFASLQSKRPRLVDIEVQLPWLSPAQRAKYTKVKVEDYQPGGYELRTQRKRRVSYNSNETLGFLLLYGYEPCNGWTEGREFGTGTSFRHAGE